MIICYWFCLLKDVQKYDAKVSCNKKKKRNHFNWIRFDAVVFEIAVIGTKS